MTWNIMLTLTTSINLRVQFKKLTLRWCFLARASGLYKRINCAIIVCVSVFVWRIWNHVSISQSQYRCVTSSFKFSSEMLTLFNLTHLRSEFKMETTHPSVFNSWHFKIWHAYICWEKGNIRLDELSLEATTILVNPFIDVHISK